MRELVEVAPDGRQSGCDIALHPDSLRLRLQDPHLQRPLHHLLYIHQVPTGACCAKLSNPETRSRVHAPVAQSSVPSPPAQNPGCDSPPAVLEYPTEWGIATGLAAALAWGIAAGGFFQLRVNPWKWPAGAADFLLTHGIRAPLFNTYEYGGYLMWRLWPQERVFIDGRALSESVFQDYVRILYNHDASGGKSAQELLDQYDVEVLVMNGFEYVTGNLYLLAPSLADPRESVWKLVYSDPQAMVLMRQPPPGVTPLPPLQVLDHLEAECTLHIDHEPQYPRCARSLGQVFAKIGDLARARKWIGVYLAGPHGPDPEAEEAYRKLAQMGQ